MNCYHKFVISYNSGLESWVINIHFHSIICLWSVFSLLSIYSKRFSSPIALSFLKSQDLFSPIRFCLILCQQENCLFLTHFLSFLTFFFYSIINDSISQPILSFLMLEIIFFLLFRNNFSVYSIIWTCLLLYILSIQH